MEHFSGIWGASPRLQNTSIKRFAISPNVHFAAPGIPAPPHPFEQT